jgi:hypothetical protein
METPRATRRWPTHPRCGRAQRPSSRHSETQKLAKAREREVLAGYREQPPTETTMAGAQRHTHLAHAAPCRHAQPAPARTRRDTAAFSPAASAEPAATNALSSGGLRGPVTRRAGIGLQPAERAISPPPSAGRQTEIVHGSQRGPMAPAHAYRRPRRRAAARQAGRQAGRQTGHDMTVRWGEPRARTQPKDRFTKSKRKFSLVGGTTTCSMHTHTHTHTHTHIHTNKHDSHGWLRWPDVAA